MARNSAAKALIQESPSSFPERTSCSAGAALGAVGGESGEDGAGGEAEPSRVIGSQAGRAISGSGPRDTAEAPCPRT